MTQQDLHNLISLAQQGDATASERVLDECLDIVEFISKDYFIEGGDANDVMQVGTMALARAIYSFKFDSGASFRTFASTCVRNAIIDEVRKSKSRYTVLPIDNIDDIALPGNDISSTLIHKETTDEIVQLIKENFSPIELDVLRLHLNNLSYEQIAQKLGVQRKKVDNTLYAIKKKLKAIGTKCNK